MNLTPLSFLALGFRFVAGSWMIGCGWAFLQLRQAHDQHSGNRRMTATANPSRSYAARFLLALAGAFVFVSGAAIAVGGRGQDAQGLVAGIFAILAFAIPAAAISAYAFRRDLSLVSAAQALTVFGMAALQFWP